MTGWQGVIKVPFSQDIYVGYRPDQIGLNLVRIHQLQYTSDWCVAGPCAVKQEADSPWNKCHSDRWMRGV